MTMIVQSDTYRLPDGSYAVGCRVAFEPKTGHYEVNTYINDAEVDRIYFTERTKAAAYANTRLMDLWLYPVDPDVAFPVEGRTFIPTRITAKPAKGEKFTLDTVEDDDDDQPTDADVQAWLIEAETRGYDEPGCLSADPAKCRCGDCLTYLAGEC